eukprot:263443-Prorocentrum_minimum.AAC.1
MQKVIQHNKHRGCARRQKRSASRSTRTNPPKFGARNRTPDRQGLTELSKDQQKTHVCFTYLSTQIVTTNRKSALRVRALIRSPADRDHRSVGREQHHQAGRTDSTHRYERTQTTRHLLVSTSRTQRKAD